MVAFLITEDCSITVGKFKDVERCHRLEWLVRCNLVQFHATFVIVLSLPLGLQLPELPCLDYDGRLSSMEKQTAVCCQEVQFLWRLVVAATGTRYLSSCHVLLHVGHVLTRKCLCLLHKDGNAKGDEGVISILVEELKNENIQSRINAIRRIQTIAKSLGPEKTRAKLLAVLQGTF